MTSVVFFVNLVLSWKSYYNIWAKGIDLSIPKTPKKKNTDIKTFTNIEIYGEL